MSRLLPILLILFNLLLKSENKGLQKSPLSNKQKGKTAMLFHITMTHTEDNCAIYNREMMPEVLDAFENLETLGKELNIKLHYFTWCGPDHVAFVLLEADTLSAVARYVFSIPMKQKINIVPVEHLHDTIAMARAATKPARD
jgi:hypothetical protein